jgi:hypothetical protein
MSLAFNSLRKTTIMVSVAGVFLAWAAHSQAQTPDSASPPNPPTDAGSKTGKEGSSARNNPNKEESEPGEDPTPEPADDKIAKKPQDELNFDVKATRRFGFMMGVLWGVQFGGASGEPSKLIDRTQANFIDTGSTVSTNGGGGFLGVAFNDYFAFQLGFIGGSAKGNNIDVSGGAVLFRVESWPFTPLGGAWRDIGIGAAFGTGGASLKRDGEEVASGGGFSLVSGNIFWDAFDLWKIRVGPWVNFETRFTSTFDQSILWLGIRTAFYAGP